MIAHQPQSGRAADRDAAELEQPGSTNRSSSSNVPLSIVSPKIAPMKPPLKIVTAALPSPSSTPPATTRNVTRMLLV